MLYHSLLTRSFIVVHFSLLAICCQGCGNRGAQPTQSPQTQGQKPTTQAPQTQGQKPATTQPQGQTPQKPSVQVVTAEQMAQDYVDDALKAYRHYNDVQVTGIVTAKNSVGVHMKVTCKGKDDKPVDWDLVLAFPKDQEAGVEVGKKVTARGKVAAMAGGTTTIGGCELVRE